MTCCLEDAAQVSENWSLICGDTLHSSRWRVKGIRFERIEVSRHIAAMVHEVFAVLRDPRGHVDIDASGMLMDATGEPAVASREALR